jgi:hypothetical protein
VALTGTASLSLTISCRQMAPDIEVSVQKLAVDATSVVTAAYLGDFAQTLGRGPNGQVSCRLP